MMVNKNDIWNQSIVFNPHSVVKKEKKKKGKKIKKIFVLSQDKEQKKLWINLVLLIWHKAII